MQLPPAFRKADCFFLLRGEQGQGAAEHRLEAVFTCSSEHAVSHASLTGQKDALSRLSPIITPQHQYAYSPYCSPYVFKEADKENLFNSQ